MQLSVWRNAGTIQRHLHKFLSYTHLYTFTCSKRLVYRDRYLTVFRKAAAAFRHSIIGPTIFLELTIGNGKHLHIRR